MTRKDIELMAPAGSYESLAAAINAGADAVYFGVGKLNMRAHSATTFTENDLTNIAARCSKAGIKSYLTLNTIIYDEDLADMQTIINKAAEAGISAIIASDIAAMEYANQNGVEVHLSTQLNISNTKALKHYAAYADVAVLARELNLQQVKHIYDTIRTENIRGPRGEYIKIEMFCHGALCMAVSGKCYLSLHDKNKSANRGECVQLCRRSYTVKDTDTNAELEVGNPYIMSPKDLKTIDFLDLMIEAGVQVLKIEGRARGADYVRTVTECYNEAIEAYIKGDFNETRTKDWATRLATVFNRSFWNGYYLGQRLGEWSERYGSAATETKIYAGKVIKYFSQLSVAECIIEATSLQTRDKLLITGSTTGALYSTLTEARVDLQPVKEINKGTVFSIKVNGKVRPNDKIYKIVPAEEVKNRLALWQEHKSN